MAILFSRDWTGTNGDTWQDAGFRLSLGSAVEATVQDNKGVCGTAAAERLFTATSWPASPNLRPQVDIEYDNASGSSRIFGILARCSLDAANCYVAEVDSNLGSPQARIRRRRNGVWATISAWTPTTGVTPTNLQDGTTAVFRVGTREDGTVELKLELHGKDIIDTTDASTDRIESDGTCGILIGPNATGDDLVFDNFQVHDLEVEASATAAELGDGVSLIIDGQYYSESQWIALGINVGVGRDTYGTESVWSFSDHNRFENPILYPGAVITVALDGDVVAFGRLRRSKQNVTVQEGHSYELAGPKKLAGDVLVKHPDTGGGVIYYNGAPNTDAYDFTRIDMPVGDAIKDLLDEHADGEDGLRAALAAPQSGDVYDSAPLDLMTHKIPGLQVSGDIVTAVESLLSFTAYLLRINPQTRRWEFHRRGSGTLTDIDLSDDHVEGEVTIDADKNRTAILIRGSKPEAETKTLTLEDGIAKGWDPDLEDTITDEKRFLKHAKGTVSDVGVDGGKVYIDIDVDDDIDPGEWNGALLGFEDGVAAGTIVVVENNTATRIKTTSTAWPSGVPAIGDTWGVTGSDENPNGHQKVGKVWALEDADDGVPEDACVDITYRWGDHEVKTKGRVKNASDPSVPTEVEADLPAVGLVNFFGPAQNPCDKGGSAIPDDLEVEMELPVYKRVDPTVPTLRVPAEGFRGTAYSFDATRWDGGGPPQRGDAAVKRVYALDVPEFLGGLAQETAFEALGDELLDVLGPLAKSAVIKIKGTLDTRWIGLDRRVRITDSSGDRDTGDLATATDLPVIAVEWDVMQRVTTVYAGTISSGQYDLQAMRRIFTAKNRKSVDDARAKQITDLLACLRNRASGGGSVGEMPPTQTCASRVTFGGKSLREKDSKKGTGKTGDEKAKSDSDALDHLMDLAIAQKGATDADGSIWMKEGDQWAWSDDGGETWHEDADNTGPTTHGGNGVDENDEEITEGGGPVPQDADDLADGSIEGVFRDNIDGILANLGKTTDANGNVLPPGSSVPEGGATHHKHDANGNPTTEELAEGETVPETTLDGLKKNKGTQEEVTQGQKVEFPEGDGTPTLEDPTGEKFKPDGAGGYDEDPSTSHGDSADGPAPGGQIGQGLGKCGTTLDGAAKPSGSGSAARGPGTLREPGTTVPSEGAWYLPPAEQSGQPKAIDLADGDTVPSSTTKVLWAVADKVGLEAIDLDDPIGVVFKDNVPTPVEYFVLNSGSGDFEQVTAASGGPGTGVNGGDYEYVTPTAIYQGPHDKVPTGGTIPFLGAAAPTGWMIDPVMAAAIALPAGYIWIRKL